MKCSAAYVQRHLVDELHSVAQEHNRHNIPIYLTPQPFEVHLGSGIVRGVDIGQEVVCQIWIAEILLGG